MREACSELECDEEPTSAWRKQLFVTFLATSALLTGFLLAWGRQKAAESAAAQNAKWLDSVRDAGLNVIDPQRPSAASIVELRSGREIETILGMKSEGRPERLQIQMTCYLSPENRQRLERRFPKAKVGWREDAQEE